MIKIQGFACINTQTGVTISYTYSELDDLTGRIIKSNIRKSMQVLETDTDLLSAMEIIQNRLLVEENK